MNQIIDLYQHKDKGYNPFLITPQWQIAQLNYSAEQELNNIVRLDIHHRTDEAFYLIKGEVVLIAAEIIENHVIFELKLMKEGVVYNIRQNIWHNIVMRPDSHVLIIEDNDTHLGDFEFFYLSNSQIDELVKKVGKLLSEKKRMFNSKDYCYNLKIISKKMNSRERFVTALQGGIPDRVPIWEYLFSLKLQKEVMGYNTELYDGKTTTLMAAKLGLDVVWAPINGFCGIEDDPHELNEIYSDEWGITYRKNGWPIMAQLETPIKSREDWENYNLPTVASPNRLRIIKEAIAANDGQLAIAAGLLGPFTMMTWYLMDFETLSFSLFLDPDLVHEMTEAYVDWALEAARLAFKTGGVDAFHISDDWGGSGGLLVSPDHFREFFLQPFKRMVQGLKSLGVPVIMHNDGKIWDMLDNLVDTGISAYHPVEKTATMDLAIIKRKYFRKICPIGNVNNKTTMVNGTPEDVRKETIECLEIGMPGGGYILSSDHSLHDDIPLENVKALIDTVMKYGNYAHSIK